MNYNSYAYIIYIKILKNMKKINKLFYHNIPFRNFVGKYISCVHTYKSVKKSAVILLESRGKCLSGYLIVVND